MRRVYPASVLAMLAFALATPQRSGAFSIPGLQPPVKLPTKDLLPPGWAKEVEIPDDEAIAKRVNAGIAFAPADTPKQKVKLGWVPTPPEKIKKAPKLAHYVNTTATLPASADWSAKANASISRMYLNDSLGCCVASSYAHRVGTWSGSDGPLCLTMPDSMIRAFYFKYGAEPGTDNGMIIQDVLDVGVRTGFPLADGSFTKLDAYASVDHRNKELVKAWISEFGGGPIGINLPQVWLQGGDGSTWGVPTGAGARVVGGHDVHVFGYDSVGVKASTWAGRRTIPWEAFTKRPTGYQDWGISEAWCPLSTTLWAGTDGLSPNGTNVGKLKKDLVLIGNGTIPPQDDPPIPQPTATITATPTIAGASTLVWSSANAVSTTLNGSPVPTAGSQNVSPTTPTTYTLVATGAAGTIPATASVTVGGVKPPDPPQPGKLVPFDGTLVFKGGIAYWTPPTTGKVSRAEVAAFAKAHSATMPVGFDWQSLIVAFIEAWLKSKNMLDEPSAAPANQAPAPKLKTTDGKWIEQQKDGTYRYIGSAASDPYHADLVRFCTATNLHDRGYTTIRRDVGEAGVGVKWRDLVVGQSRYSDTKHVLCYTESRYVGSMVPAKAVDWFLAP